MSSKRKSPPSKLQEGSGPAEGEDGGEEIAGGSVGESSDYRLEEGLITRSSPPTSAASAPTPVLVPDTGTRSPAAIQGDLTAPPTYYKLSSDSSSSGSELEDFLGPEEALFRSPPNKKSRFLNQELRPSGVIGEHFSEGVGASPPTTRHPEESSASYQYLQPSQANSIPKSLMAPPSLQALLSLNQSAYLDQTSERLLTPPSPAPNHHHHHQHNRRRKSGCESPSEMDKMAALLHLNNNSTTLNHNNSPGNHLNNPGSKRTMDDVLKRLTSKMNSSTIREEKRPSSPGKIG